MLLFPAVFAASIGAAEALWGESPAPPPSSENPNWMWNSKPGDSQVICEGYDEAVAACKVQPACPPCSTPVNCQMGAWAAWSQPEADNCNQICSRKRKVEKANNECGQPCKDKTEMTKRCALASCTSTKQDCSFGEWNIWSGCTSDLAQKDRFRPMIAAKNGGAPCTGSSKQTEPCGNSNLPINCKFTTWHDWTACSTSCGQGIRTRARRWFQEAQWGGRPCGGAIQMIGECKNSPACAGAQNCVASAWSRWVGCDAKQMSQKFRVRSILQANSAGGLACPENIKETLGCPSGADACGFRSWLPWSACDRPCGGGQMRRSRTMSSWLKTDNMKLCPDARTQETQGCNPQSCLAASDNCILEDWTQWGTCRPSCGTGMAERKRKIQQEAKPGGVGCVGPLEELRPCTSAPCTPRDCVWGLWSGWGACSATCGGGTHQRTRTIAVKNRHGGKDCSVVAGSLKLQQWPWSQIAPCNTASCTSQCINGTWGMWGAWSVCSATCDTGFRSRRRDLAQVPNACGNPAEGAENEIVKCQAQQACTPSVDCQVGKFSEWSTCSSSCFGTQDRQRLIERFATGNGRQCPLNSLKEIRPCNPQAHARPSSSCTVLPYHNCTVTTWGQWTDCPVSCGGGQHTRARRIIQPPSGGGVSCGVPGGVPGVADGNLTMTRSCNTNKCGSHCINCKWGQWAPWGACSKCGGQRYRTRRVEQLPNHCGASCLTRAAQQTSKCPSSCEPDYWCIWAAWSAFTQCSGTCGNVTKQRQRSLSISRVAPPIVNASVSSFLFKSHKDVMCAGTQFEVNICTQTKSCTAVVCDTSPCLFGSWSVWGPSQMTGLCQRHRIIATNNGPCGIACEGNLIETKACIPTNVVPRECELSQWGQWSHCPTMLAQSYRVRGVRRQASNGGSADNCGTGKDGNALRETVSCKQTHAPIDCGFTDWTIFGVCTRTCGGGWKYRTRQANHPPTQHKGEPCVGLLKEIAICNSLSCEGENKNCKLGLWSDYGVCFLNQKSRFRGISTPASGFTGEGCEGSLEDTMPCETPPVNCQVSDWTAWDTCDLDCGGGQQNRHRTIWKHNSNGGTECPRFNKQTQGCNLMQCVSQNCEWSTWGGWSYCDTNCGIGQKRRTRTIATYRTEGGTGCEGDLEETLPCGVISATPCPVTDCKWGAWSAWNGCSKDRCGTGFQTRTIKVATPAGPLGKPCSPRVMTQTQKCNTARCDGKVCTDGQWTPWGAWKECSASCGGGITWRLRQVGVIANDCGQALIGNSQQVKGCKNTKAEECDDANRPCEWGHFGKWSDCNSKCNGYSERTRVIKKYGKGTGAGCEGPLREVQACNPVVGRRRRRRRKSEQPPAGCPMPGGGPAVDCTWTAWSQWNYMGHLNAGCTLISAAIQTDENLKSNVATGTGYQSCTSGCSHQCGGGVQFRHRTPTQANNGGKLCHGSTNRTQPCNQQLCTGSKAKVHCKWSEWSEWGQCDTCNGKQERQRDVVRQAKRGGNSCLPGDAKFVRKCNPPDRFCGVAKYCVWSEWANWGACSATCGTSTKKRRRNLQASDVDPYLTTVTTTDFRRMRLYDQDIKEVRAMRQVRVRKQGQMHIQELVMAFAAGGASLFLVLVAMRAFGQRQSAPRSVDSHRSLIEEQRIVSDVGLE